MHTALKGSARKRIAALVDEEMGHLERVADDALQRFDKLQKAHQALKVQNEELRTKLAAVLAERDKREHDDQKA